MQGIGPHPPRLPTTIAHTEAHAAQRPRGRDSTPGAVPGDNSPDGRRTATGKQLNAQEEALVRRLEARDAELKSRSSDVGGEASAFGATVVLRYRVGPDGRRYAVAADVVTTATVKEARGQQEAARRAQAARTAAGIDDQRSPDEVRLAHRLSRFVEESSRLDGRTVRVPGPDVDVASAHEAPVRMRRTSVTTRVIGGPRVFASSDDERR